MQSELDSLNRHIGGDVSSSKTKDAVRLASDKARDAGVWRGASGSDDLNRALDGVRATKLDPIRQKAVEEKLGSQRGIPLLFSPEIREEIAAGARLVHAADTFISRTLERVEQEIAALGGNEERDAAAIMGISQGLEELTSTLHILRVNKDIDLNKDS